MTADSALQRGRHPGVRYLPVGRFFLNAETDLVRAWRLLWEQQTDFLGSEGKEVGRGDDVASNQVARAFATTKLMLRYLYARFVGSKRGLNLPLSGDLAIERLSGAVKLLDLAGRRVYTLMRYDGSRDKLVDRIASARHVGNWPFAPSFEGADLDGGWLAEEHIPGVHPTGFRGCRDCFDDYYLPLLVAFQQAEEPLTRSFADYVGSLSDDILAPSGLLTKVESKLRGEITAFVGELEERLRGSARVAAGDISLTLSHGDFFSGNVILTPTGQPRAIDWATTGTRSPLFDLYYLVMNHCVRVMAPSERHERFGQMLDALRTQLGAESPAALVAHGTGLTEEPELRWLFYLECVHVPLMHCDDPDDRYIKSLATRIGWFKDFERAMEEQKIRPVQNDTREVTAPTATAGASDA